MVYEFFVFQAEDGIRDLVRSRGLGDVYKRQHIGQGSPNRANTAKAHGEPLGAEEIALTREALGLSLIHI